MQASPNVVEFSTLSMFLNLQIAKISDRISPAAIEYIDEIYIDHVIQAVAQLQ